MGVPGEWKGGRTDGPRKTPVGESAGKISVRKEKKINQISPYQIRGNKQGAQPHCRIQGPPQRTTDIPDRFLIPGIVCFWSLLVLKSISRPDHSSSPSRTQIPISKNLLHAPKGSIHQEKKEKEKKSSSAIPSLEDFLLPQEMTNSFPPVWMGSTQRSG